MKLMNKNIQNSIKLEFAVNKNYSKKVTESKIVEMDNEGEEKLRSNVQKRKLTFHRRKKTESYQTDEDRV